MKVKITKVTDRNSEHKTKGHDCLGAEGEINLYGKRAEIPHISGDVLLTSPVEKITIETKNSIYEMEALRDGVVYEI